MNLLNKVRLIINISALTTHTHTLRCPTWVRIPMGKSLCALVHDLCETMGQRYFYHQWRNMLFVGQCQMVLCALYYELLNESVLLPGRGQIPFLYINIAGVACNYVIGTCSCVRPRAKPSLQ